MLLQRGLWSLGIVGLVLLWLRQPNQRSPLMFIFMVPAAWVLFYITIANGQPRYLLSVAPLMVIGAAYLTASLSTLVWLATITRALGPFALPSDRKV